MAATPLVSLVVSPFSIILGLIIQLFLHFDPLHSHHAILQSDAASATVINIIAIPARCSIAIIAVIVAGHAESNGAVQVGTIMLLLFLLQLLSARAQLQDRLVVVYRGHLDPGIIVFVVVVIVVVECVFASVVDGRIVCLLVFAGLERGYG